MAKATKGPPGGPNGTDEKAERRWRLTEAYFNSPEADQGAATPAKGYQPAPQPAGFRPSGPPPGQQRPQPGATSPQQHPAQQLPPGATPPMAPPGSRPRGGRPPMRVRDPNQPPGSGPNANSPRRGPAPTPGAARRPNPGGPPHQQSQPHRQRQAAPPRAAETPKDPFEDLPPDIRAAMQSAPLSSSKSGPNNAPNIAPIVGMPPGATRPGHPGAQHGPSEVSAPPQKKSIFSRFRRKPRAEAPQASPVGPVSPGGTSGPVGPVGKEVPSLGTSYQSGTYEGGSFQGPDQGQSTPGAPLPPRSARAGLGNEPLSAVERAPSTDDAATASLQQSQAAIKAKGIRRPTSPIQALEPRPAPAPAGSRSVKAKLPKPKKPNNQKEPSQMRRSGGFVSFAYAISTIVLLFALAGTFIYYGKVAFEGEGPLAEPVAVLIEKGTGLTKMAEELERQGVIDDSNIFVIGVTLNGKKADLKAGEYAIPKGASMAQVMNILSEGKAIQFKVTVPEGLTSAQVVEILNAREDLTGPIDAIPAEGTLLPETYSFPRNTTRQEIIDQMRRAQQKVIDDLWAARAPGLPISSIEEALTLASIVEKETGQPGERRQVASVFVNRLKRKMRLQSDPTIIYGITEGKGPLGRPIFQSDIDRKTAWNTYQINGLPPTPIANPGRAAIESTLNPDSTEYLFFVADGTGGHAFAVTLAEHTANVARWRQIERKLRQEQAQKEAAEAAARAAAAQPVPSEQGTSGNIETETRDLVLPGQ